MKDLLPFALLAAIPGFCGECPFLAPEKPCASLDKQYESTNVYTQLSFLYWESMEKGLDFALKNRQSQIDGKATMHRVGFNFEPACRLMIGTHLPEDWKIDATWSFFLHHIDTDARAQALPLNQPLA